MIYAVLNTKGGVGKTTTALNLAIGFALKGLRVLAVDGDRQGTLLDAIANREARDPQLAVAQYVDGKVLRQQVLLARDKFDVIVIDAGGRDNTALRAALAIADVVITPFQPRSYDVWAFKDMVELIEEARAAKDVLVKAVLTMADPRGGDNAAAQAAVPDGIDLLPVTIGRRKAIADAAGDGLSLLELPNSRDTKAVAELQAFVDAVSNIKA